MTRLAAPALLALLCGLSACAPDISALANDPTKVCVVETSVWLNFTFSRNGGCYAAPPGFMLVPVAGDPVPAEKSAP